MSCFGRRETRKTLCTEHVSNVRTRPTDCGVSTASDALARVAVSVPFPLYFAPLLCPGANGPVGDANPDGDL